MQICAADGITEFVDCCGYKRYLIKEYLSNCFIHTYDMTFDLRTDECREHRKMAEPWQVTLVDTGDATVWEEEPLAGLATDGQLMARRHHGFWQPMDTLRDKLQLERMWTEGQAPWKIWETAADDA